MPEQMFVDVPQTRLTRSRFPLDFNTKTTFNAGKLVPFFSMNVIAGSTVKLDTSAIVRMTPTVTAPMGDASLSIWYFFVPYRTIWDKWKNFCGELEDYWTGTPSTYTVPGITFPSGGFAPGGIADHFGIPVSVNPGATTVDNSNMITSLQFRAFTSIWNEFFRDENLQPKAYLHIDSTNRAGSNGAFLSAMELGGQLPPLARPHDIFGSALPFPQKGNASTISLAGSLADSSVSTSNLVSGDSLKPGLLWAQVGHGPNTIPQTGPLFTTSVVGSTYVNSGGIGPSGAQNVYPTNLALVDDSFSGNFTINSLRASIAIQHLRERQATGGTRYREILSSIYGIDDPNPNRDVPTYLGGKRVPISVQGIVQTSATGVGTTPQGNVTGYSNTGYHDESFTYTALEHGVIIGCMGVRNKKSYQNGVDRQFRMFHDTDYYNPYFAGMGEMPVRNDEIFLSGNVNDDVNSRTFGYQPAFYWEVNRPDTVTGMFRSGVTGSLASWHYADNYATLPVLGQNWIQDNSQTTIDRTLAVTSSVSDQFLADITCDIEYINPMPLYNVPGMQRI